MLRSRFVWAFPAALCGLSAAFLYAQQPAKAPPAEYELTVGQKKYDVASDQPFTIETPNGEKVELTLHPKTVFTTRHF